MQVTMMWNTIRRAQSLFMLPRSQYKQQWLRKPIDMAKVSYVRFNLIDSNSEAAAEETG